MSSIYKEWCYELDDLNLLAGAAFGTDHLSALGGSHPCPKAQLTHSFTLRNSMWIMHINLYICRMYF